MHPITSEQEYLEADAEIARLRDWFDDKLFIYVRDKQFRNELHKRIEDFAHLARALAVYECQKRGGKRGGKPLDGSRFW
jgi:hypothetical protein